MQYDFRKIEKKWQEKWESEKLYQADIENAKRPFYNLMMFPYPSAEGLHVGNMYAFTGSDIYGRYMRLKGYDVFEPMGLDGFGIHSENFAIKNKIHPAVMVKKTEKRFYEQFRMIGNAFDWSKKLETYDPGYYKWTQWLFLQMFKAGLAYKKKANVNWCPSCKTVLSDEQVIKKSKVKSQKSKVQVKNQKKQDVDVCERCGTEVVLRELTQWFFKITNYAEKLLKNIDKIDWTEKTKLAQKNWIGKSEGALIKFQIPNTKFQTNSKSQITNYIDVFTTRPDTLFGCTYLVLSPEHKLIKELKDKIENWDEIENYIKKTKAKSDQERVDAKKEKTGVELKGIKAINPANKKEISVWVADYVLAGYGTGAIMAVPAHDERDFTFAKKYKLPIIKVILPPVLLNESKNILDVTAGAQNVVRVEADCYIGEGVLVNSGKFNGTKSNEAKKKITEFVGGKIKTNYKLRDWCISRQRFWGPPIPLVFCENCADKIKNKKENIKNIEFSQGELQNPGWIGVPEEDLPVMLPKTDDYLPDGTERSPLARNEKFVKTKCPKCGGEAKRETDVSDTFLDSAWYFLRYPSVEIKDKAFDKEITKKWLPVNMYIGGHEHAVLHLLYTRFTTMVLRDLGYLNFEEPFKKFRAHGLIIKDGAKMSKSKGNVVNPDDYIKKYGADVLRTYLMFIGPFKAGGDFRDEGVVGIMRFFDRLWNLGTQALSFSGTQEVGFEVERNKLIKKATFDIENLDYNTIISGAMSFINLLEKNKEKISKKDLEVLVIILAPFAPHLMEELWEKLGNKESVFKASWPVFDESKLKEEKIQLIIQINGKMRSKVEVKSGLTEEEAKAIALEQENVKKFMAGSAVKKVIFVRGRLINIVI